MRSYPEEGQVLTASIRLLSKVKGSVLIDITIQGYENKRLTLSILSKLCSDILVGHDVVENHSTVDLTFEGPEPPLSICSAVSIEPETVRHFRNPVNYAPIAIKLRRYSEDMKLNRKKMLKLLSDNIVALPW